MQMPAPRMTTQRRERHHERRQNDDHMSRVLPAPANQRPPAAFGFLLLEQCLCPPAQALRHAITRLRRTRNTFDARCIEVDVRNLLRRHAIKRLQKRRITRHVANIGFVVVAPPQCNATQHRTSRIHQHEGVARPLVTHRAI